MGGITKQKLNSTWGRCFGNRQSGEGGSLVLDHYWFLRLPPHFCLLLCNLAAFDEAILKDSAPMSPCLWVPSSQRSHGQPETHRGKLWRMGQGQRWLSAADGQGARCDDLATLRSNAKHSYSLVVNMLNLLAELFGNGSLWDDVLKRGTHISPKIVIVDRKPTTSVPFHVSRVGHRSQWFM